MTHTYYIYAGSTTRSPEEMEKVTEKIRNSYFPNLISSSFFLSPGYGSGTGKVYTNGVYKIKSSLDIDALSLLLKTIEILFGRDKKNSSGEVALDLDIVETDSVVIREKDFNQEPYKKGKNELDEITKTNKTSIFSLFRNT
ncbi:MAG: 2-amino-4-hydroxy-6-hydroxymethyldihydropteridine diphosphokinase [Porphyromonas sp.]|nr:2-amino-4-hydroxy-6-hydroxymethyldihydropteridine diphosphokinase [Porphyromonas sp.]